MKRCPFFPTLILFLTVVLFVGHASIVTMPAAFGAGAPSVKRALLIGIGKYQVLPRLPGSKNDIDLVHQVLLSRYGFAEQDIHIIRDEAATRDGVLAGLHRIVTEAGPNDVVYIHYSGHGSQVEDLNGDEPDDQLDETIVPTDGRTEGVPDITDDELDEILSRLKTSKAVVVLDSCHSGTATRGVEVRVRSVPEDRRVNLYKKGGVATRAIVPVNLHSYVLFSGAASHEEALDGPVDGRYHGFFTHSLFKSLQSAPMGASTREIFSGAKQELKRIQNQFGRTSMPEPQLEASKAKMELPFFSALAETPGLVKEQTGSARRSWVAVQPQTGDHVGLVNALSLGADPGSVWGIYPEGEVAFDPAKAQAFAVVQAADGQNAVAVILPKQAEISSKSRAVLVAPAPESKAIPVALRNVPPVQAKQLKELLGKQMGDVKFVGDQEFARFIVESRGDGLHVLSADGTNELMSLPAKPGTQAIAAALSQVLVQSRNASQLLNLENPSSQMSVSVRVVQVGERGIAVVSDKMEAPVYHIRQSNQPRSLSNSLQLEVASDTDAYITIVDVDAEGNVNVLFPNSYQNPRYYPDGFIMAGRTVLLPDSLQSGNQAGFHFDYANPPGVDTIRVFASTTPELAQRIRQAVVGNNTQGLGSPQSTNSLAHLASLRQELVGSVTRGLITVPDDSVVPVSQPAMSTVEQMPLATVDQLPPKNSMPESIGYIQDHPAESFPPDPSMPGGMNTEHTMDSHLDAQAMPVGLPVSDWTAVSVTVLVQP